MSIDCVRRGIHVIVEKPVATTFEQLDNLGQALADHPGVHLIAMQTMRYLPGFFTAYRLVRDGAIGDVRLMNAQKSYKLGNRPAFYHQRNSYGGTIPWVGAHGVDWLLWIGGHRIRSATALHTSAGLKDHASAMELTALCQFAMTGDRFASLSIDVLRPANATTHGDDRLRVVGSEGVIEATPKSVRLINASNDGQMPVELLTPPTLFGDFVSHIESGSEPLIGAHDSLATTAACLLAREAADLGRTLDAETMTSLPLESSTALTKGGSS
jgi:predicted dehydrogenase